MNLLLITYYFVVITMHNYEINNLCIHTILIYNIKKLNQ